MGSARKLSPPWHQGGLAASLASLVALLGVAAVVALVSGCTPPRLSPALLGSGTAAEEERKVAGFDSLRCGSVLTVDVQVGPAQHVHVEGDDNLLRHIRTDAAGGTLYVRAEGSFEAKRRLRVVVAMPRLRRLIAEGAAQCNVVSLRGDKLEIECRGSSQTRIHGSAARIEATVRDAAQLRIMGLAAEEIRLDADGSGQVEAAGTAASLNATLRSAATLQAYDLVAKDALVEASGASRAEVTAKRSLSASARGSASLRYRGEPATTRIDRDAAATIQAAP